MKRAFSCARWSGGPGHSDATHNDPRTRHQARKLAIKVVELAELLSREPQDQSSGDTYNVLQVGGQPIPADDRRWGTLRRLREITGS